MQPFAGAMHAMDSYIDTLRMEMAGKNVAVSKVQVGWYQPKLQGEKVNYDQCFYVLVLKVSMPERSLSLRGWCV